MEQTTIQIQKLRVSAKILNFSGEKSFSWTDQNEIDNWPQKEQSLPFLCEQTFILDGPFTHIAYLLMQDNS